MTDELLGIRTIEVSKPYCFCSECGKLIIGDGYSSCVDNYCTILCAECEEFNVFRKENVI